MTFQLKQRWMKLHWVTRLSALVVFAILLWWQSRYTWSAHNPMYGWPMPFDNLWNGESLRPEYSLTMLLLDCGVWIILAGSTGFVLERWRRKAFRFRPTFNTVLAVAGVVAMIIVLGCAEVYLRNHPNNDSIFPRYARVELGKIEVWFDIGLFTDPICRWPLIRIVMLFAIGSCIYTAGCLLYCFLQRRCFSSQKNEVDRRYCWAAGQSTFGTVPGSAPIDDDHSGLRSRDPIIVRVAIWMLFMVIGFYWMIWLLGPRIY